MGMVAILVMAWLRPFIQKAGRLTWNLTSIGPVALEEMFESVDDDYRWLFSKLTLCAFGSGELKISGADNEATKLGRHMSTPGIVAGLSVFFFYHLLYSLLPMSKSILAKTQNILLSNH